MRLTSILGVGFFRIGADRGESGQSGRSRPSRATSSTGAAVVSKRGNGRGNVLRRGRTAQRRSPAPGGALSSARRLGGPRPVVLHRVRCSKVTNGGGPTEVEVLHQANGSTFRPTVEGLPVVLYFAWRSCSKRPRLNGPWADGLGRPSVRVLHRRRCPLRRRARPNVRVLSNRPGVKVGNQAAGVRALHVGRRSGSNAWRSTSSTGATSGCPPARSWQAPGRDVRADGSTSGYVLEGDRPNVRLHVLGQAHGEGGAVALCFGKRQAPSTAQRRAAASFQGRNMFLLILPVLALVGLVLYLLGGWVFYEVLGGPLSLVLVILVVAGTVWAEMGDRKDGDKPE